MSPETANLAEPRAASAPAVWGAALYDAHPHALVVIDATGRLLHANRAAQWLAGGGRLRSLFDLLELPPDPSTAQALRFALRDGAGWTGTVSAKSAAGDAHAVCFHLLAASGTAKAGADRVCILERQRVPDEMPALLWSADESFAYTWVSQGFVDFTGRRLHQLLGQRWLECVHPEDRERCVGIFRTSQQARVPFGMDLRVRRHDDEYRCLMFQAAPAQHGYAGLALDIHERNRLETQLAENSETRRRNDLRQGHFLAGLSHELRSPLAPISNAASVLRTLEDGNPTLRKLREILERQVARMRRTLDELVDVTQALRGELMLVRRPVALNEVLQIALAQNQRQLDAMGQRLQLRLPPRAVTLEGDSVRLAQMFSGLLENASKFSPDGAAIDIVVERVDGSVRASVKDSGRGISAAFLPRVFDLFAQETRQAKGGLGTGLTLARRIAQYHGGELEAHSDGPGTGAEFVVTLPLTARRPRAGGSP